MKLGDIKAEALRLMFVNFSYNLSASDIVRLSSDETYGSYIVNMNGSINRGLDVLARRGVIPMNSVRLEDYTNFNEPDAEEKETAQLNIPDYAARILPYYIKSELYAEDDSVSAKEARMMFYSLADEIAESIEKRQLEVIEVFKGV